MAGKKHPYGGASGRKAADFLSDWLTAARKPDPSKLSRRTVRADRWDNEDYERILKEMRDFDAQRSRLCETMEDTGNGMTADTFFSLFKVEPEPVDTEAIRPDYLINALVRDELMGLSEFEELRGLGTVGDDVNAAMGFIALRPELETIYDKLQKERDLAEQLAEQMRQMEQLEQDQRDNDDLMAEMQERQRQEDELSEEEQAALAQAMEDAQARADEMAEQMAQLGASTQAGAEELESALQGKLPGVRAGLAKGMDQAIQDARDMQSLSDSWGMEPGTLQRMPAEQRLALAKRIKNNPKLNRLAQLIGPMKRLAFTEQRRKIDHARQEVHNIEQGDDIERLLPDELAKVRHPVLKWDFRRRYVDSSLLQYRMRGTEKVGMGGIICEIDSSGSMEGDREIWAKAVGMALLNIAKTQKRAFYGIHFGATYDPMPEFDFRTEADYTPDKVLDFCEYFLDGGTDFQRPLTRALEILQAEHKATGSVKGDVVFITDGHCHVDPTWMADFKAEQERLGFNVFGILVGGGSKTAEPLHTICDSRVFPVHNLVSGDDVRDVFSQMNQP